MSNVLELTEVQASSKGNERKSGQLPSKLRFTPASELSLVNNVKSGLIAKRVEKYNLRHSQLTENTVATTADAAAVTQPTEANVSTPIIPNNGVQVAENNQQNILTNGTVTNATGVPAAQVAVDANGQVIQNTAVAQQAAQPAAGPTQAVAQQTAQPVTPEAQPVVDQNNAAQAVPMIPLAGGTQVAPDPTQTVAQQAQPEAGTPAMPIAVGPNQVPGVEANVGTAPVEEQVQQVSAAEVGEDKNSKVVLANSQIMKNASMDVNKLEGNFGTLGINFGVNVKPEGLIPKALSVPQSYSQKYLDIFKQVDVYKNLEAGSQSLINVSKELSNLNQGGQPAAEETAPQVPEAVVPVGMPAGTPVVPAIPVIPKFTGGQEEDKSESQSAIPLALADFSNAGNETPQNAGETSETQQASPTEGQTEPAANWKNLFEENNDTPTEKVAKTEAKVEEDKPKKVKKKGLSAEELEQRKLLGNFGAQLKEVRNLQHSGDNSQNAELVEKENSILGMMSNVIGGDKITENTEVENNVEEQASYTEEQPQEESPIEAQVEQAIEQNNKFQGMFGKLNDGTPAATHEEEQQVEEQSTEQPVQEGTYVEQTAEPVAEYREVQPEVPVATNEVQDVEVQPTEQTNKFLGDFANEEPVEQTNKFLGDFANEEPVQEEPVEQTNKFLGDFASEESTEEVAQNTGKFLGGFEQEEQTQGKFLGDLNAAMQSVVPTEQYVEEVQAENQGGKFLGGFNEQETGEVSEVETPVENYSEQVEEQPSEEETNGESYTEPVVEENPQETESVENYEEPVSEEPQEEATEEAYVEQETEPVENNIEDEEIAYLDPSQKNLEPEDGIEKQDVNNNGRLIIDEKPVIDALVDDSLNEKIKDDAKTTAQRLYEHNKRLDEMDEESLPKRHKKTEVKSNLSADLDNMDLVSAVKKHLSKAQDELVNTVNLKIGAIEDDLLAAVSQKIKQAEQQAEEANRSKAELEEQLRELVSREERRESEQTDTKVKAKKKKKVVSEDEYEEDERVAVASKEDVEEVKKKLRNEVASEVNKQLDEAQLILADAVDQKIKSAQLELAAAVNTQIQNAQLELKGAVNEQIENFRNEMVAPNEELINAQEQLSRSVTQQVENAQLALKIAIDKQVEEAQEKLEEAKIGLQEVASANDESEPVQEEQIEEMPADNWTENSEDYPSMDSSEEQKEVAATIASWINEDNDYIESNEENLGPVGEKENQQPEEPSQDQEQVEETPQEENYEEPVQEEQTEEIPAAQIEEDIPAEESLPKPIKAQINITPFGRRSHAPLVVEKLTEEEPTETHEEVKNEEETNTNIVVSEEKDNKDLEQALEQVWLGNNNEALNEQDKTSFVPFVIDRYSAQTIENNDKGYNVVTASKPIKLNRKYIEILSKHLNGEGNKEIKDVNTSIELPNNGVQASSNETVETPKVENEAVEPTKVAETPVEQTTTVSEVPVKQSAAEQQLGMEILRFGNRYCNVVSSSRPIRVPKVRKDNISKRYYPKSDSQVQSKKDLLNSLKDELNSNEFDFMRYDNTQEVEKRIA